MTQSDLSDSIHVTEVLIAYNNISLNINQTSLFQISPQISQKKYR